MASQRLQTDRDLASIAEARALARRAKQAWLELAEFSQEQIDAIVDAMAAAADAAGRSASRGWPSRKPATASSPTRSRRICSPREQVYNFIRPMKTVGVVARHEDTTVVEIAEPFGVVAAVVPSTNPTSTAIYKILISHQGALRDRPQPAPVGRELHHARRRSDGRGGARAPARRPGRSTG